MALKMSYLGFLWNNLYFRFQDVKSKINNFYEMEQINRFLLKESNLARFELSRNS